VLAEIKDDDNLKSIPVIILTISKAEEEILRSYNLHANCYLIKPIDLNKFFEVVKSIEDFWLTLVKLPKS
jgi:response regulator RpfG family c-di-GMP phosphodiesterase